MNVKIYTIIFSSFIIIGIALYFAFRPATKLYISPFMPAEITQLQPISKNMGWVQAYDDIVQNLDDIMQTCEAIAYSAPKQTPPDYHFIIENNDKILSLLFYMDDAQATMSLIQNQQIKNQVSSKTQARFYRCPSADFR